MGKPPAKKAAAKPVPVGKDKTVDATKKNQLTTANETPKKPSADSVAVKETAKAILKAYQKAAQIGDKKPDAETLMKQSRRFHEITSLSQAARKARQDKGNDGKGEEKQGSKTSPIAYPARPKR